MQRCGASPSQASVTQRHGLYALTVCLLNLSAKRLSIANTLFQVQTTARRCEQLSGAAALDMPNGVTVSQAFGQMVRDGKAACCIIVK
ncbi:hypothetical protein ISCGN_009774 [Ixodes scapularis]